MEHKYYWSRTSAMIHYGKKVTESCLSMGSEFITSGEHLTNISLYCGLCPIYSTPHLINYFISNKCMQTNARKSTKLSNSAFTSTAVEYEKWISLICTNCEIQIHKYINEHNPMKPVWGPLRKVRFKIALNYDFLLDYNKLLYLLISFLQKKWILIIFFYIWFKFRFDLINIHSSCIVFPSYKTRRADKQSNK